MGIFRITWEVFRTLVLKRIPFNRTTLPYYIAFVLNVLPVWLIGSVFILMYLSEAMGGFVAIPGTLLVLVCASPLLVLHHEVLRRVCITPSSRLFLYVFLYYRFLCFPVQLFDEKIIAKCGPFAALLIPIFSFDTFFNNMSVRFVYWVKYGGDTPPGSFEFEALLLCATTISGAFLAITWLVARVLNRIEKRS